MSNDFKWDDIKMLTAVGHHGSMAAAGLALGIAPSTISRRLTRLEETFGALLVERFVEGCRLTPDGERLARAGHTLQQHLETHFHEVHAPDGPLRGTVTLTTGEGFSPFVMRMLGRFRRAHPECRVRYVVGAQFHDIVRGEVDVALRTLHVGEPSLMYRKLTSVEFGVFAHPSYAAQWEADITPEEVDVVGMLDPVGRAPYHVAARQAGLTREVVRVSNATVQLDAVREGLGVGVLAATGAHGLVRVFEEIELPPLEVFLVTRPQALRQPHIRAFVDMIYDHVAELGEDELTLSSGYTEGSSAPDS